jgi:hypothetical protein
LNGHGTKRGAFIRPETLSGAAACVLRHADSRGQGVITDTIATEMTRKWIKFQAVGEVDKTAQIKAIEDEFTRLGVKEAFKKAAENDGFFGRRICISTQARPTIAMS